jgi:hypothetical protein
VGDREKKLKGRVYLEKEDVKVWTGLNWLMIGFIGGLFLTW